MKSDERALKELVDRSIPTPSHCELEIRCDRVLQKLQSGDIAASEFARLQSEPIRASRKLWRVAVVSVATAVALLVALSPAIRRPSDSAIAKSADGIAYKAGETFRSISGNTVMALVDGSRIEMRSGAEASVERASDGLSVHLTAGGVVVNAAKQTHRRHLYVKTKDVTISVVGTVFLVNVEAEGSTVVVLEGEVRVVSGGTSKTLARGEQFVTKGLRETQSTEGRTPEIRTAAVPAQQVADRFEVATVRPSSPPAGGAGARGAGAAAGPPRLQIEHHRFIGTNVTLHRLITFAYDLRGLGVDRISGGPGWIRSDQFDIQALTPDEAPDYTTQRLLIGDVPKLRLMVRDLLANRFKLTLHNVVKEMPIYNLVAVKGGKLKVSDDQTPPDPSTAPQPYVWGKPLRRGAIVLMSTPGGRTVSGTAIPITTFSNMLQEEVGRVIVDKTGLHGLFDINLEFAAEPTVDPTIAGQPIGSVPAIFTAIQEQLGLKLESANGRVELLMIDHAEKPFEN